MFGAIAPRRQIVGNTEVVSNRAFIAGNKDSKQKERLRYVQRETKKAQARGESSKGTIVVVDNY